MDVAIAALRTARENSGVFFTYMNDVLGSAYPSIGVRRATRGSFRRERCCAARLKITESKRIFGHGRPGRRSC